MASEFNDNRFSDIIALEYSHDITYEQLFAKNI